MSTEASEQFEVRIGRRAPITMVADQLAQDARLSLKARGLALYLLSCEGKNVLDGNGINEIARANRCGRDQVKTGLQELVEHGYLTRVTARDEHGRISRTEHVITDQPDVDHA